MAAEGDSAAEGEAAKADAPGRNSGFFSRFCFCFLFLFNELVCQIGLIIDALIHLQLQLRRRSPRSPPQWTPRSDFTSRI